jgi:hypothetical protein
MEMEMRIGSDTLLETDLYDAELIDYTDTRADGSPLMTTPYSEDEEPKPQWRFTVEITTEGFEGVTLAAWVTKPFDENSISPKAKLVQLVQATLPDLARNANWKIDDLLHQPLRVQVELYKKRDGTDANKITKFLPAKKTAGARPAPRRTSAPVAREPEQASVPF